MNFTSLAVAVIAGFALVVGALIGLASAVVSPRVQGWIDREHRIDERAHSDWAGRRDVYADLLAQLDNVMSAAEGAIASRRTHAFPAADVAALNRAEALTELRAPASVWAEMKPHIRAVAMCINKVTPGLAASTYERIEAEIKAQGLNSNERREELRSRFVEAARSDLGPEPPAQTSRR